MSVTETELSDELYDGAYASREDLEFYLSCADRYGDPILELGCGTGRILLPIAELGYEITGLDLRENRIRLCEDGIIRRGIKNSRAVVGDMKSFSFEKSFNLITTPFRGFQHLLNPRDQLKSLRCMYHHLISGGHVIIDIFNPSIPFLADKDREKEFVVSTHLTKDGKKVTQKERVAGVDFFLQRIEAEEIYYIEDNKTGETKRIVNRYSVRYTFKDELAHLMVLAGFEIVDVYGDYGFTPYGEQSYSGEVLMVGKKI